MNPTMSQLCISGSRLTALLGAAYGLGSVPCGARHNFSHFSMPIDYKNGKVP